VRIATDYNDYLRLPVLPDIVTMNHAHDTHFSDQRSNGPYRSFGFSACGRT
jgi:hypothetical protein